MAYKLADDEANTLIETVADVKKEAPLDALADTLREVTT